MGRGWDFAKADAFSKVIFTVYCLRIDRSMLILEASRKLFFCGGGEGISMSVRNWQISCYGLNKKASTYIYLRVGHRILFRSERSVLFSSFWRLMRPKRTQRSFAKNVKERKNVLFFCKRTQNILFFFQYIYIDIYRDICRNL